MHHDSLLASTDVEDALAQLYVAAVAARAGYVISKKDFDRDGIDITVEAGGNMRPKLDIQLKATVNLKQINGKTKYTFQCPKRNYELLRPPTQTPRILVVLRLHKEPDKWLSLEPEEMILRHSAYWISLSGAPAIKVGQESKAVHLPVANRLNHTALQKLMEQSRTGSIS